MIFSLLTSNLEGIGTCIPGKNGNSLIVIIWHHIQPNLQLQGETKVVIFSKNRALNIDKNYLLINFRRIALNNHTPMWLFTSTLVVTSLKINVCSVFAPRRILRSARVSVAPRLRDRLNTKDADVTSLPKCL